MESLDGISELHMSGSRAVFETVGGLKLPKSHIAEALEEEGLGLVSYRRVKRPRAERTYLVDAGIT